MDLKIQPAGIADLSEKHRGDRTFPGVYRITDGIFDCQVGGHDALDALVWYSMPTKREHDLFTYDPDQDVATFSGTMVAAPVCPNAHRSRPRRTGGKA